MSLVYLDDGSVYDELDDPMGFDEDGEDGEEDGDFDYEEDEEDVKDNK